jgi:hypothetical protein
MDGKAGCPREQRFDPAGNWTDLDQARLEIRRKQRGPPLFKAALLFSEVRYWALRRQLRFVARLRNTSLLSFTNACSSNDNHSVTVVVAVMMMTPTMVAIRLRIRRSREEGKESKYQ